VNPVLHWHEPTVLHCPFDEQFTVESHATQEG